MFESRSYALLDAPASLVPEMTRVENRPTRLPVLQPLEAKVLHVGCGTYDRKKLPLTFLHPNWREIRLDIDPAVHPDVVASITDMGMIADASIDAVYSSHNIEHLYPHEVPVALREMSRVLNAGGFLLMMLPDLQEVARYVAEGGLEDPIYLSPMGPIAPLDILYGHRQSLASGNLFMAHRTGFTATTIAAALIAAGFAAALVQRNLEGFSLTVIGFRSMPSTADLKTAHEQMEPGRPAVLYATNIETVTAPVADAS